MMLKFIRSKGQQQPSAERQKLQKELYAFRKVSQWNENHFKFAWFLSFTTQKNPYQFRATNENEEKVSNWTGVRCVWKIFQNFLFWAEQVFLPQFQTFKSQREKF